MIQLLFANRIVRGIGFVLLAVLSVLTFGKVQRIAGKREARQETALEAAERMAKAHKTRERIEDAIQGDTDLVARSKRAGVVSDDGPRK